MSTHNKSPLEEEFERHFSSEKGAGAEGEGFGDDLGHGSQNDNTSENPESNTAAQPGDQGKDQFEESDALSRTALMETYNG